MTTMVTQPALYCNMLNHLIVTTLLISGLTVASCQNDRAQFDADHTDESPLVMPGDDSLAVHKALKDKDIQMALELLKSYPPFMDVKDPEYQETPLHIAAHRDHIEVCRWLLDNGANVHDSAYSHFMPIHLTNSGEITTMLLEAGANPTVEDAWGYTALQSAVFHEYEDKVQAILSMGHELDIRSATMRSDKTRIQEILQSDPDVLKDADEDPGLWGSSTPLGIAAGDGDMELVQLFLSHGASVDAGTRMPNAGGGKATALTNAVWGGHYDIAKLLLEKGADCNVTGGKFHSTIGSYAKKHGTEEMIKLLESYDCPMTDWWDEK